MQQTHTVVGLFENENDAQMAVQQLSGMGISQSMIDITKGNKESFKAMSGKDDDNAFTRFFKNLFGDDNNDAKRYSTMSSQGYSIVTVHASSSDVAEQAADILDNCGAVDVDERAAEFGMSGSNKDSGETTINRVEENLEVGKRTTDTGGVRVRSRIVEKPVEENLRLREEHVHVERNAVNRPLTDMDKGQFKDQDIELTERAEVPVVNKEARVVEEIKISKDVTHRDETIHDTVRHTEVDIDGVDADKNDM
ncbi:MAG: YsnF/AvaK domain-containing protein [Bacteroidota bacterium]|nr:YsnF/AvaK domain-containing protein [Bacteroidota bacterium]